MRQFHKLILCLVLGCIAAPTISLHAQDRVYLPFDLSKIATFPGGYNELHRFVKNNIHYPKNPEQPTGNRLIIAFVVEKDGTVNRSDTHIFETPGEAFTEAVLSRLQTTIWNPAEANGNPVRYLMALQFFFHHSSKKVSWSETSTHFDRYEQLLSIPPKDYSKIRFLSQPKFMGIDSQDSIEAIQHYPEAARLANVQGEVSVDVLIQKNGQVGAITLMHDIGYGCGEEALRLAKLYRDWVPAQVFDSTFEAHRSLTFAFCPNPQFIKTSQKIYKESELWSTKINNYYNIGAKNYEGKYTADKNEPLVKYNGSIVEFEFTVTKTGVNDSIAILSSPDDRYTQIVQGILQREKMYEGPSCCNFPCHVRFHRYASFRAEPDFRGSDINYVFFTRENPVLVPNLFIREDEQKLKDKH